MLKCLGEIQCISLPTNTVTVRCKCLVIASDSSGTTASRTPPSFLCVYKFLALSNKSPFPLQDQYYRIWFWFEWQTFAYKIRPECHVCMCKCVDNESNSSFTFSQGIQPKTTLCSAPVDMSCFGHRWDNKWDLVWDVKPRVFRLE